MPSKEPTRSLAQRLDDILQNIDLANGFIAGTTFPEFALDTKTVYAVTRAVEIISEASRHIPAEIKAQVPHINWRGMAAVGNVYRHGYDLVEEHQVWNVIQLHFSPLRAFVIGELQKLGFDRS